MLPALSFSEIVPPEDPVARTTPFTEHRGSPQAPRHANGNAATSPVLAVPFGVSTVTG